MPTYDYRCDEGHRYDKREPFGSPSEQPCDECGATARRVLHAPPVVFKGSGWYKTDSRSTSKTRTAVSGDEDSKTSEKKLAAEAAAAERDAKRETNAAKKKAEAAKTTSGGASSSNSTDSQAS